MKKKFLKYSKIKLNILRGLLFGVLLLLVFSLSSTCFATYDYLTPINQMTPEIAQEIFDFIKQNNSYYYLESDTSLKTTYDNFYSNLNETKLQSFCDNWNSKDFSSYAEYLEQCVFYVSKYYENGYVPQLNVIFNNNNLSNINSYVRLWDRSSQFIFLIANSSGTAINSKKLVINFSSNGNANVSNFYDISSSGQTIGLWNRNFDAVQNSGNNVYSSFFFCYHLPHLIFARDDNDANYYSKSLNGSSVLEGIAPPVPDPELFDGVILSYDNGIEPVGTIISDAVNLKYHYDINTTYSGPNIHGTIYVYLEELTPGQAVLQTPYSVNNPSEENGFTRLATSTINYPSAYNVKYRDLLSYMKNGYIYRLQIGFVQRNVSGDSNSLNSIVHTDICTSEFFSKDSWYSDKIIVKNIYKLVGDNTSYSGENGVVILQSGDSGDKVIQGISDIQNSLVDLNKNITGTIESTILGTPNESGDRQGGLVGNLLEGLWSGFIHLFIPDSQEFYNWLIQAKSDMTSRGGFLLYSENFWLAIINLLNNNQTSDFIITLPEFSLPVLDNPVIWEETTINLNDYFEQNQVFQGFYTTYLVLISGLSIFLFCKYLWSLWESIISGMPTIDMNENDPKFR